jgi:hypothetical protein
VPTVTVAIQALEVSAQTVRKVHAREMSRPRPVQFQGQKCVAVDINGRNALTVG